MIQKDRLYSADDLYTIQQREDEPLREYAACFSHEYSRYLETDDRGPLYPPNERTEQYSVGHKRKDNHDSRQGHSKKGRGKYSHNDHWAPLPNHDRSQEVFALLNTTYEAVLMNENEMIPKPNHRKPNRQDNRDIGKFCRYHQHNSHNTEECISLRKIIERLIREGKLNQYIAKPPQGPIPNTNRQINMISTISEGSTLAGTSNRSVKQYVRAANYPQVFGVEVNRQHKVLKVGSVNVIFADALKGMGMAENQVNRQITPLLSFSGDLVQPVGSVSLPIPFGVATRKK
ncbi:unnamed protein product [Prunus brigantina]